jgi:hypothetical protein
MSLDENERRYVELMQSELEQTKIRALNAENNMNMSSFQQTKDQNMIEYQLDLKEELDRIFHLLSGHVLQKGENGEQWIKPTDDRLKIFSDYGVKQIMNIISFYINRNTLLSNYTEEVINWKIRDFGIELSDLIYNRYEVFFHYPTPEELFNKLRPLTIELNDDELYNKCILWSKEELQSKLRHYPMIVLALVDSVHSTYLRALGGKERESLRKAFHVTESSGGMSNQIQTQKPFSLIKPSTW